MKITRVGVELAKNVFQLHGVELSGECIWKRKLSHKNWLSVLLKETDPSVSASCVERVEVPPHCQR